MLSCPLNKEYKTQSEGNAIPQVLCDLCRSFYEKDWLNAAGGGIAIRDGNKIYFGPSGLENKNNCPLEIYILDIDGKIKEVQEIGLKVNEHRSVMFLPHLLLKAGTVIHSHSMNSMLVTWLFNSAFCFSEQKFLKIFHQSISMQSVRIPIIENHEDEKELAESFSTAMKENSELDALLVRGHGFYVWGKDWVEAKNRVEFYEFLFDLFVKLKQQEFSGSGGPECETK